MKFKKIKSNVVPNLHVLFSDTGIPLGMVEKPRDDRYTKSLWRCYVGTGDKAVFLCHAVDISIAKNMVKGAVRFTGA